MTGRARSAMTAGVLVIALVVVGAGFPTRTVSPEQYAGGVCTAIDDLQGTALRDDVAAMTSSVMAGKHPSRRQIRRAMVRYYGELATASRSAARKVAALGDPQMPRGREIARGMVRLFTRIHAATVRVHRDAQDISSRRELQAVGKDFNRAFDRFTEGSQRLRRLDPDNRLEQAADASPACAAKPLKPSR